MSALKKKTSIWDDRSALLYISRDKLADFRNPAIRSFLILSSVLWVYFIALVDHVKEIILKLEIQRFLWDF